MTSDGALPNNFEDMKCEYEMLQFELLGLTDKISDTRLSEMFRDRENLGTLLDGAPKPKTPILDVVPKPKTSILDEIVIRPKDIMRRICYGFMMFSRKIAPIVRQVAISVMAAFLVNFIHKKYNERRCIERSVLAIRKHVKL
ncbi:TotZ [Acrasis kona]|uniref:TotZ n=1 Tax=Acrasis kona TaxID=1008807 RepID=A0AAW2ZCG1_9EUKA